MSVKEMWRGNAVTLFLLILLNMALFSLGNTPWTVLGLICLAFAVFFAFRQGMGYGHQACSLLETVKRAEDPNSPAYGQLDEKVLSRAWSVSRGVKAVLVSALIPYLTGCAYIICSLLNVEPLIIPLRLASWVLAVPFWPVVLPWYDTFDRLTPVVAAVLMLSPFLLPLCTFGGYLQGPKLWAKSEKAMAEGKRRAKAKSRVIRKKKSVPRSQRPEI